MFSAFKLSRVSHVKSCSLHPLIATSHNSPSCKHPLCLYLEKRILILVNSSSHSSSSPPSVAALKLLKSALSGPYPPSKPSAQPLAFNLEVIEEQPPTSDQLRTIASYLPSASFNPQAFVSAHPTVSSDTPLNSEAAVRELAQKNPRALKWPIVVDWSGGRAAVGDVEGVKGMLEALRKDRDGEA